MKIQESKFCTLSIIKYCKWSAPLFFVIAVAPFTPFLDLYISSLFFENGKFHTNAFFDFLFNYGELFGFAICGSAGLVFVVSFFYPKWKRWRYGALVMVLTLVVGAGLITNSLLKANWGRSRPKQVIEFGGKHSYTPFWRPNFAVSHQKSFPSGHVALGFYYLSLCLIAKRYQSRFLFYSGFILTFFWGGGLMIARLVQGGHFFSDVIISPLIMWYVALGFDRLVFRNIIT